MSYLIKLNTIFMLVAVPLLGRVELNDNMKSFPEGKKLEWKVAADFDNAKISTEGRGHLTVEVDFDYENLGGIPDVGDVNNIFPHLVRYSATLVDDPILGTPYPELVPDVDQQIIGEAILSFRMEGIDVPDGFGGWIPKNPFGVDSNAPYDALRMGYGGIIIADSVSGQTVCFFITNEGIYAFQDSNGVPPYDAWASATRVADRSREDIHSLAVAYNRATNSMVWLLDGEEVARHDNPGVPGFAPLVYFPFGGANPPASDLSQYQMMIAVINGAQLANPMDGLNQGLYGFAEEFFYAVPGSFQENSATVNANKDLFIRNIDPDGILGTPEGKKAVLNIQRVRIIKKQGL